MKGELLKELDGLASAQERSEQLIYLLNTATRKLEEAQMECDAIKTPSQDEYIRMHFVPAPLPSEPTEHSNYSQYSFKNYLFEDFPLANPLEDIFELGFFCGLYCFAWSVISFPIWLIKCIFRILVFYPFKYKPRYDAMKSKYQQEMAEYYKKLAQIKAENQKGLEKALADFRNTDWESVTAEKIAEKERTIDDIKKEIYSLTSEKKAVEDQIARYESEMGVSRIERTEIDLIKDILRKDEASSVSDAVRLARQIVTDKNERDKAKNELFETLCQFYLRVPIPDGGAYWDDLKEKMDFKFGVLVFGCFVFKDDSVNVRIRTSERETKDYSEVISIPEVLRRLNLVDDFKTFFYEYIKMWKDYLDRYEIKKDGDCSELWFSYHPTQQYLR